MKAIKNTKKESKKKHAKNIEIEKGKRKRQKKKKRQKVKRGPRNISKSS